MTSNAGNDSFAVMILSHGRPDRVYTYKTLRKQGYTGKILIVIDDEDEKADDYKKLFGDEVVMFSKSEVEQRHDAADIFYKRKVIWYARNACFDIAERLGIRYFFQFDDDYTTFEFRFSSDATYIKEKRINDLDVLFSIMLDFYVKTNCLTLAVAQSGDFMGGKKGSFSSKVTLKRKAMNTFLLSVDRKFSFVGRINEDVNTYVSLGNRGFLFFTTNFVGIKQKQTQKNKGGMTETYLDSGTYLKSFYSIMLNPSSVRIWLMGYGESKRLHHKIFWNLTVPKILRQKTV